MRILSDSYENNTAEMGKYLRLGTSFDIISRTLKIGADEITMYYIDGFVKDGVTQRLMQYFLSLKGLGSVDEFVSRNVPYVEVEITNDFDQLSLFTLSGAAAVLGSTFGGKGVIIDLRTYPARQTEEPETDKVMQGAKDGFVETLIFNTALIRRRIRDPRLTMRYRNLGGSSQTDCVICFMEGVAESKYVEMLTKKLESLKPSSLTLGYQSLAELLIPRRWYNPFPKIRTLTRPDAASAELMEGKVLIICDTSPQVMVLPTSLLDYLQETEDYYLPPLTGSYQRIIRFFSTLISLFLSPLWYLFVTHPELLPDSLNFILPDPRGELPLFLQLLLAELAVDALKLASMNTPTMLANSLSIIGALILGDYAVSVGWLCADVILYVAIVSLASFSQKSQELSYAIKFMRFIVLVFTALFGLWGFVAGIIVIPIFVITNKTINGGHSYLYPLIPFNGKALARLFFRLKKRKSGD